MPLPLSVPKQIQHGTAPCPCAIARHAKGSAAPAARNCLRVVIIVVIAAPVYASSLLSTHYCLLLDLVSHCMRFARQFEVELSGMRVVIDDGQAGQVGS